MNFAKILYVIACFFFASPVLAADIYTKKEVVLDNLGYKQPVYKQVYFDKKYSDQQTITFLSDPDNFPFSSKKQGSILYELFLDFFNDRHLFVKVLYPKENYQEELFDFENNNSKISGVLGLYFGDLKYSKNKYIYPAFAENGVHLITSKDKNIDVQTKEDLKKYKGAYAKDDKFDKSILKDFSRLGIVSKDTFDNAIEDLLTGRIDFVVASYYRSQIKLYKLGLMNYVNYSLDPVWRLPMFLKVSPKVATSKNIEYLKQYFQSSSYKQKRDKILADIIETYKENTKGVIPPTYMNSLQTELK
jgi:hypothetical protein